jgi:hypothetical protein
MTKKDYIIIANAIKQALAITKGKGEKYGVELVVSKLSQELQKENNRFDIKKFCQAIYIK